MNDNDKKLSVGKNSVVIGNVSGNVGDGSVVVGPTDDRGNVILNQSMAVGRNAHAGPGSIAIGANAGAGSNIAVVFNELSKMIEATADQSLIESFKELCSELNKDQKDKSRISGLWNTIKNAAALGGAVSLVKEAGLIIASILA